MRWIALAEPLAGKPVYRVSDHARRTHRRGAAMLLCIR